MSTGQSVSNLSELLIIFASVKAVIVKSSSFVNMPGKLPGCIDADTIADKGRCESLTLFVRAALVYSEVPAVFLDRFFNRIVGADFVINVIVVSIYQRHLSLYKIFLSKEIIPL